MSLLNTLETVTQQLLCLMHMSQCNIVKHSASAGAKVAGHISVTKTRGNVISLWMMWCAWKCAHQSVHEHSCQCLNSVKTSGVSKLLSLEKWEYSTTDHHSATVWLQEMPCFTLRCLPPRFLTKSIKDWIRITLVNILRVLLQKCQISVTVHHSPWNRKLSCLLCMFVPIYTKFYVCGPVLTTPACFFCVTIVVPPTANTK